MTVRYVKSGDDFGAVRHVDVRMLEANERRDQPWRRWLVRAIGTALLIKLVALLVIKSAFFSADRAPEVTPQLVDEQLAIEPPAPSPTGKDAPR
jgi:hypothetical protein